MGEFASKGLSNGIGIPALVLGSLGFLQSGGLGGGIGGLFGGGNQAALMANAAGQAAMSEKDSIIARLQAEKYTDQAGIEVYKAHRSEMNDTADRILGNWVKPLAEEAAANRERLASLEATVTGNKALCDKDLQLTQKDIEISKLEARNGMERLDNKIDVVALTAKQGISANSQAIQTLQAVVSGITKIVVPKDVVCPEPMNRFNSWTAPTTPTQA